MYPINAGSTKILLRLSNILILEGLDRTDVYLLRREGFMEIKTRNVDDITVVDVFGSLDTQSSGAASDEMTRIIEEGSNKMLVNLENLEYVSSAGLRVLLRTAKQLNTAGGILKLCNPAGAVKEVMDIAGFSNFLDLHDSESDALSAF